MNNWSNVKKHRVRYRRFVSIFDRNDFEKAQLTVIGFDRWTSYEDYCCERDGQVIGFASAGLDANTVSVSLAGFVSWASYRGKKVGLRSLDEFARFIALARENPVPSLGNVFRGRPLLRLELATEQMDMAVGRIAI
jgi:hypothetical protein